MSCSENLELSKAIQGNWQIYSNTVVDSVLYNEIFIDSDYIHVYMNPIGLIPSDQYYIEKDSLYLKESSSSSFSDTGKISFKDSLMVINTGKGVVTYRKLDNELSLGKLKNSLIDDYVFGPAFYERMENWAKIRYATSK